jgi:hypothetical protein
MELGDSHSTSQVNLNALVSISTERNITMDTLIIKPKLDTLT